MKPPQLLTVIELVFGGCFVNPVPPTCAGQLLEGGLCYSMRSLSEESSGLLEFGDFNGDSLPDLLEGGRNIFLNNGDGSFEFLGGLNFTGQSADLDGDSFSDLFFLSQSLLVVQKNQQNLSFDFPVSFDTGVETPDFVQSADLDADSDLDLLVASPTSYAVLTNDGQANFSPPDVFSLPLSGVTAAPRVSDLNQDTFPDIAYLTVDSVCILLNDGNALFGTSFCTEPDLLEIPGRLNFLDLDEDLFPDLIGLQLAQLEVFVLFNLTTAPDQPSLSSPNFFPGVEAFPQLLSVSDLDTDGAEDLLLTHSSSSQLGLWLHRQEPFLSGLLFLEMPEIPRDIIAKDVNQDALPDLAVSTELGLFLFLNTPLSPSPRGL